MESGRVANRRRLAYGRGGSSLRGEGDMSPAEVERAAELLVAARRARRPLAALPESCRPRSLADAYAIQDAVGRRLGPVGGWKVGAAGRDDEPRCAPLPAELVLASPTTLAAARFSLLGIEAEVAFRLGRDLPPRERPYGADEVIAAIAAAHPAIELVDSRFTDREGVDKLSALADANSNGAFVYGPAAGGWPRIDWSRQPVELSVDGRRVAGGTGSNPAGDLVRLVVWLANHCAGRGGLKAGQLVTTGSWTGLIEAPPGSRVVAEFAGLGRAELTLTP
jgi:2-keto-4-pentenoate hydratase